MSRSWYNVTNLKKCTVYLDQSLNSTNKFIMFGPDYFHFKRFHSLEALNIYAEQHNLQLTFKDGI